MFTSSCGLSQLFGVGTCATIVGVEDGPPAPGSTLQHGQLSCAPNPIQGQTTISFAVPNSGGPATVSVFDVRGRLVRAFKTEMSGGKGSLVWDGRSGSGQELSSGIYYVRLEHAHGTIKTGVVLLH
jgi:flagellar hook assembly protein FlgD